MTTVDDKILYNIISLRRVVLLDVENRTETIMFGPGPEYLREILAS